MKKLFYLMLILPLLVFAQDPIVDTREKLMFGIKAGTNYSNVYDSKGDDFKVNGKFGLAAGAFLTIPIGKYLGIQPEVLFSQKGFQATGNVINQPYDLTRTSNYLDIPLYITFKPIEFLTIMAGPQFSYLIQQKDKLTVGNTSVEQRKEFDNQKIGKNTGQRQKLGI